MSEKFKTPCPLPNDYEAELLTILIEECAEVQQRATIDDGLLTEIFKTQMKSQKKFTRRIVITMAHMLDATPRGVVLRCEDLGLAPNGCWDWFKANGGITKEQISDVISSLQSEPTQ